MIDPEKQQLTLNIADERIVTMVLRKDEYALKKVEKEVDILWNKWKLMHPSRTKTQILAMMAFQYAKLYYDVVGESKRREKELSDFIKEYEGKIDEILLEV